MAQSILIVDDEKEIVSMLYCYFSKLGYTVYTATAGNAALKEVEKKPDIILLDVNMPDIDGFTVCERITLLLLVCIVGCSQAKDSDNHVVQDYSEEYEVSPYGSEEALDTLGDLKISMSTEKDLDLKHLSFLIENTSDKEYRYSPNYFEIETEQSGTWYQLEQLDDPSKSNEKDCFIKPNERLTLEIDVKSFYGELPAGHYRLIKQFAFFESERDWDYDTYNLSCEFTIR